MTTKRLLLLTLVAVLALLLVAAGPLAQGGVGFRGWVSCITVDDNANCLDVLGRKIDLDLDGDTSITADTDDQIDFEIGAADEFIFTAGILDIGNGTLGRIDLDADNDTSIRSSADDQIDFEIGAADEFIFTAGILDIGNGTLGRIDLDADNDTSLRSSAEDQIDIELGGADQVVLKAVAAADSAATNEYFEIALTVPVDTTGVNTHNMLTLDPSISNSTGGTNNLVGLQIDPITGDAEVTETAINFGAGWDVAIQQPIGAENLGMLKSIQSTAITFTAAAGGSGTLATITDGEIWFVHSVFIRTTTNFDATGDDVTFVIGDGNDADGFIVAVDANLQAAFTEATGYAAGWYGIENGSGGAYTLDDGGPFVYAPSGADETIDWLLDETSGETITAGELTAYVVYTRIQ